MIPPDTPVQRQAERVAGVFLILATLPRGKHVPIDRLVAVYDWITGDGARICADADGGAGQTAQQILTFVNNPGSEPPTWLKNNGGLPV